MNENRKFNILFFFQKREREKNRTEPIEKRFVDFTVLSFFFHLFIVVVVVVKRISKISTFKCEAFIFA